MSFLNQCFDYVYVVSCGGERLEKFRKHAESVALQYHVVPGFDHRDWYREKPPGVTADQAGRWGCMVSHARALFHASCQGMRALALEDDVNLGNEELHKKIIYAAPEKADLIFLGCGLEGGEANRHNDENGNYWIHDNGWHSTYAFGFTCIKAQRRFLKRMSHCPLGVHFDTALRSRLNNKVKMWRPAQGLGRFDYGSLTKV